MAESTGRPTLLPLACAIFGGLGGHWLITPNSHPGATPLQYAFAWAQLLVGTGLAMRFWRASHRQVAATPAA